jgi:hypothetical protein
MRQCETMGGRELYERAAVEQNPEKLLKLVPEINAFLADKQRRVTQAADSDERKAN